MGKGKLKKWEENSTFDNVFQPEMDDIVEGKKYKAGTWKKTVFGNTNPLVLELGCGKGEYTVGQARLFPNKNFLGVDIKGHRFWRGAKTSKEEKLENVAFLRTRIEFIDRFFEMDEVDEIWLTFSDPQPKDEKGTKRITGPYFMEKYKKFLKNNGIVHIKTDNKMLYSWSLEELKNANYEILESTDDLYGNFLKTQEPIMQEILQFQTHYERIFIDYTKTINYIKLKLR